MPKKKQQKKADAADSIQEGRPAVMTFGDLLDFQLKQSAQRSTEKSTKDIDSTSNHTSCPVGATGVCASIEQPDAIATVCDNKESIPETHLIVDDLPRYYVCRTKKGGIPVKVESRASGKKVTLLENVVGDSKSLLQELKSKFGTGGIMKDGFLELQGDCMNKLTKYLNENKQILKPYGTKR